MDRRTLNKKKHQLCYSLPTEDFLERDESISANDIWAFLHDAEQRWYFNSDLDASSAYVFDTLGTPHGAVILPGEDVAEQYYLRLNSLIESVKRGNENEIDKLITFEPAVLPSDTTAPLRQAVVDMETLLHDFNQCQGDVKTMEGWLENAGLAMDKVVRKSLEMRAVAVVTPDIWPFK
ncbi:hypothetical protein [Oceanicoccus sp. KOV_DT_Chl]|uniref:hypothetical protein n=1 Tax=Oceanicoccus sp. KOV_DT_Chl TaxID=1904639 RepID=UPI000C79EEEA|nr:hypothetical protein [Oceanicoccus sp. KOV_DT_Chl]